MMDEVSNSWPYHAQHQRRHRQHPLATTTRRRHDGDVLVRHPRDDDNDGDNAITSSWDRNATSPDHEHENDGTTTIISYESFHAPLHEQQQSTTHMMDHLGQDPLPLVLPTLNESGVKASRLWNSLRYYAFSEPIRLKRQCATTTRSALGAGGCCHHHDDDDEDDNDNDGIKNDNSSAPASESDSRTNACLGILFVVLVLGALILQSPSLLPNTTWFGRINSSNGLPPPVHVAFVGNSMLYYNDVPRLLSQLSAQQLTQQSCLHGDATFTSILKSGNGMVHIWETGNARIDNNGSTTLHDFGACTVPQLLLGYDDALDDRVMNSNNGNNEYTTDVDDFATFNDLKNPCLLDSYYYQWLQQDMVNTYGLYNQTMESVSTGAVDDDDGDVAANADDDTSNTNNNGRRPNPPHYDFVVLNDNTRSPARVDTRKASLAALNDTYLPLLLQMPTTIPVFMATYGYSTPYRDMGGLGTVAVFTSLTHYGYQVYADALRPYLPKSRSPRVAPVGIAFLTVWEENFHLWQKLFGVDQIHASPLGTYLQGCVLYHTIYGRMPNPEIALRGDMSGLWHDARRFQPGTHRTDSFPTLDEARYLYHVAYKVSNGYKPSSFLTFSHGEAAEYTPQDDLYRVDDLF